MYASITEIKFKPGKVGEAMALAGSRRPELGQVDGLKQVTVVDKGNDLLLRSSANTRVRLSKKWQARAFRKPSDYGAILLKVHRPGPGVRSCQTTCIDAGQVLFDSAGREDRVKLRLSADFRSPTGRQRHMSWSRRL